MFNRQLLLIAGVLLFAGIAQPAAAHHRPKHSMGPSSTESTTTTSTTAPSTTTTTTTTSTTTTTTTAAPAPAGPAAVCGASAILDGPAEAPPGAVVVNPGTRLDDATNAKPAGTTFYLTAGTHTLGDSVYGQVIPKEGNSYIGAPGAVLDGRGVNRYAFTQKAAKVTVKHLTVTGFMAPGDEGVVNHDFAAGWVIERNTIHKNNGAGVMLGDDNVMSYNCLADNGQYGFQGFGKRLTIDHNEIARNNVTDWETNTPGCGCSGGSKFWSAGPGTVTNNWVHDNHNVGLWWDNNNVGFLIEGNTFEGNRSHAIFYETSYNAVIRNNTFLRNAIPKGQEFQARNDSFPVGAIYISEAGGEARVNGGVYPYLEISGNTFDGNWGGVVAWENADRFGHDGSANTSKGWTTLLVDPSGAHGTPLMSVCGDPASGGKIDQEPYRSDCRWKTNNLQVFGNTFAAADPASIGCTSTHCNRNGLFSNFGTYPSWSPYKGRVVQDNITFKQNNVWRDNAYNGQWSFLPYEMSNVKSFAEWQAAPYNQDAGSTYNGSLVTVPPPVQLPVPAPAPAPATTSWFLRNTSTSGIADLSLLYGDKADLVVSCDWDGDGIDTPGIYRAGTFFLRSSNLVTFADVTFSYGRAGDIPVCGDWDGNGTQTVGVKRGGAWHLRNTNSAGIADLSFVYGVTDDIPVIGDWNSNGSDTVGVKRGGAWHLRNTNSAGIADLSFVYGVTDDIPVTGDWDSNGSDTVGAVRPVK